MPPKSPGKLRAQRKTRKKSLKTWSGTVTRESDALDLKSGVFTERDPKKIAASLKRSAEHSTGRKVEPFRSGLSMLIFHINRRGKNLPASPKRVLERAKLELRRRFVRA